jgi:hexosaminidase
MVGDPIFNTGAWIGYLGTDMQAVIDLKEMQKISSVEMTLLIEPGNYIFGAEAMKVEISEDGENFKTIKYEKYSDVDKWKDVAKDIETVVLNFDEVETRYVRVTGESVKCMPKWHGATGEPAWIFVGEISIK